jgi:DNA-binding FadR family transcriptional regulator
VSSLSSQLRSLAIQVAEHERQASASSNMLDTTFDLHNELTNWICNTDHDEAAEEVSKILEAHLHRSKVLSHTSSG